MDDATRQQIIKLYRQMPGAPRPPREDGYEMWGGVEGNQHWEFCAAIVTLIAGNAENARLRRLLADKQETINGLRTALR